MADWKLLHGCVGQAAQMIATHNGRCSQMFEMLLVWRDVPQVELLGKVATDGDGQGCAFHLLNVTFESTLGLALARAVGGRLYS